MSDATGAGTDNQLDIITAIQQARVRGGLPPIAPEDVAHQQFLEKQQQEQQQSQETWNILASEFAKATPATPETEPSLSERLFQFKTTPLIPSLTGVPMTTEEVLAQATGRPFTTSPVLTQAASGFIYPVESLLSVSGVSPAFSKAVGRVPTAPPVLHPESPAFLLGLGASEIVGTVAASEVAGAVVGVAGTVGERIEDATKIGQKIATSDLVQSFKEGLQSGEEFVPNATDVTEQEMASGRAEDWILAHSEAYHAYQSKQLSYGIVDVPDIGIVGSLTPSERMYAAIGDPLRLETPYTLKGLAPIEAEATAMSFADVPRTLILDPELVTPQELPITREIFTRGGLPFIPEAPLIERPTMLPQLIGTSAFLGAQVLGADLPHAAKSILGLKVSPVTRTVQRLDQPSMVDVAVEPDIAQTVDSITGLNSKTVLSVSPVQAPASIQTLSPPRSVTEPSGLPPQTYDPIGTEVDRQFRRRKRYKPIRLYRGFERTWPIATSRKMAYEMLGLNRSGKKKKKRKT
jgi:hypothetical protein